MELGRPEASARTWTRPLSGVNLSAFERKVQHLLELAWIDHDGADVGIDIHRHVDLLLGGHRSQNAVHFETAGPTAVAPRGL
jgi:hypothetical protein